jgi:hypothetical protein
VQIGIDYQINQNSVQSLTFTARAVKPDSNSEFGNPAFNDLLRFYLFSETLVNNGMPLQASIATWHEDPILKAPYTPFSLLLDYSDKGFLIEYVMPNKIVGNSFLGCPAETYIRITMWSPDQNYSIEDVLKWGSGGEGINSLNLDYFRPIDQATPMNLETFFQSFNKSESKICLETPVDLWFKP